MTTEEFIRKYRNDDVRQLALQASRHSCIDMPFALDQIAGWQTACRKLPSWAATDGIVYPPHISMEQCSSELTARYKAFFNEEYFNEELRMKNEESIRRGGVVDGFSKEQSIDSLYPQDSSCHIESSYRMDSSFFILNSSFPQDSSFFILHSSFLIDLTGGFGVDFSFMSRGFSKAVYVERQEHLCDVARKNFEALGLDNVEVVCADGVEYLHGISHADVIYLDPARRDMNGRRTYAVSDCTPDVLEIEDELLDKADLVILKLSPMLDITETVACLQKNVRQAVVKEVHIVSVNNECKELLFVLSKRHPEFGACVVVCVDLKAGAPSSRFSCLVPFGPFQTLHDESSPVAPPMTILDRASVDTFADVESLDGKFLYEPNASIMKSGCFTQLCNSYEIIPLGPNSHLFISSSAIENFPGRMFRITGVTSMNKKNVKKVLCDISKANITVRNFPMSVSELRKRLGLSDGGDTYIFATTVGKGKKHVLVISEKV